MNETERDYELGRLQRILREIEKQLSYVAGESNKSQNELRNTLADYWANTGGDLRDEAQLIETVNRQRGIASVIHQGHLKLKKAASSPYFGRIDFVEDCPDAPPIKEAIYIGIATLADRQTGELLVYDWRAPVSGMFYDFERGKAWYECPAGTITGEITLKRQYKIVDGKMLYLFDCDLKIDDEILQEILGKSADDKMHTIINSIQREQNKVIRNNSNRLLFVQGPAGSGKTSIALHRVAYLLYRDRNVITAQDIMIFSPSRLFNDYISNVLPEMGEENVVQTTFQDYVAGFTAHLPVEFEERPAQLEYLLSGPDHAEFRTRTVGIAFKSSPAFTRVIQNYVSYLTDLVQDYPPIQFRENIVFSQENWQTQFFKDLSFLPPGRRLAKIRQLIQMKLRPFVHDLRREKEAQITAAAEEVNEKTIKALARIAARNDMNSLHAEIERLTDLPPLVLYRQLFADEPLFHRLATGITVPDEWRDIRVQTLSLLDGGQMPYEDSIPFLFFQGLLEGFPANYSIRHLVIDEAQDYTPLQYEILARLFPKTLWTVLGDPAQSVHPYLQTASFEIASGIMNIDQPLIIHLSRSYRSTQEIQAFCQALLPGTEPANPINRAGALPQLIRLGSRDTTIAWIVRTIAELREEGRNSIAIICKTALESQAVYQSIRNQNQTLNLITSEDVEFRRGTVVIPSYLAKGLEFDAVIVYDASNRSYGSETDRNILYTVCTRALHRLVLYCSGELSPFIAAASPDLYNITGYDNSL